VGRKVGTVAGWCLDGFWSVKGWSVIGGGDPPASHWRHTLVKSSVEYNPNSNRVTHCTAASFG
jgi:hypothetical protein